MREVTAEDARLLREGWRERMIQKHEIDMDTLSVWGEALPRLGRYLGPGACERLFGRALLLPPGKGVARVLVESYAQKSQVGELERRALEITLTTALGRKVEVDLLWES